MYLTEYFIVRFFQIFLCSTASMSMFGGATTTVQSPTSSGNIFGGSLNPTATSTNLFGAKSPDGETLQCKQLAREKHDIYNKKYF